MILQSQQADLGLALVLFKAQLHGTVPWHCAMGLHHCAISWLCAIDMWQRTGKLRQYKGVAMKRSLCIGLLLMAAAALILAGCPGKGSMKRSGGMGGGYSRPY